MAHHRENPRGSAVGSFYDRMTPEQRAELDEGIAQAEREQVLPAEAVFDRLAKRSAFRPSERNVSAGTRSVANAHR
jgi:hypothetical protein